GKYQLRSGAAGDRIEKVIVCDLHKRSRAERLDGHGGAEERRVGKESLAKEGLKRFQGSAVWGGADEQTREVVAGAVGAPDVVEAGRRILPGDVVTSADHLWAKNGPVAAELAGCERRSAKYQLRSGTAGDWIEKIIVCDLHKRSRAERLDGHG